MRRIVAAVLTAVVLVTIPVFGFAQGKVTKDPNAAPPATAKAPEPDPRLDRKITYDSGAKRLHDVVDDLARMSGVNILSGKSKDDWRIKDIPLVVYVKDMPLGRLLTAIADATHTHLGSEVIGKNDPKKSYRIYRRFVDEAKIDNYFDNRHKTRLAQVKWQWDAMAAYGKSKEIPGIPKATWPLAKVIASLDQGSWDKIENGYTLRIPERDAQTRDALDDLYRLAWNEKASWVTKMKECVPGQAADDNIQYAVFKIKLVDTGGEGRTEIQTLLSPIAFNMTTEIPGREPYTYISQGQWDYKMSGALQLKDKLPGLPPYPEPIKPPAADQDMANPDMLYLKPDKGTAWPEPLTGKFALEKPKDAKDMMFADFVRQLATASRLNIVTEDFSDQWRPKYRVMDRWFEKETNVGDTIIRMSRAGLTGYQWFFGKKDNLLLGWADDRSTSSWGDDFSYSNTWRHHHKNLVAESYLDSLKKKLAGDGVDFDDAVRLSSLSRGSFGEWISNTTDLACLSEAQSIINDGWWPLYDALSPEDKKLAKSSSGLPLGKFDPNWAADFFRVQRLREDIMNDSVMTEEQEHEERSSIETADRITSDPKIIFMMVMRLKQQLAGDRQVNTFGADGNVNGSHSEIAPKELKIYTCRLEIDYKMDGADQKKVVAYSGNLRFPVRTPEREAEIIKAAKDAETKPGPNTGK